MKTLARIVSYIFHPLLVPTLAAILILYTNPHLFGYPDKKHGVWLIIVFSLTFAFPAVFILMMKGLNMINSLEMETTKERVVPLIASATFFLWATWFLKPGTVTKFPPNVWLFYMLLGACFSIFMALILNVFMKVSLHTIGAGSLFGILLVLLNNSNYDLRLLFVAVILIMGLVGSARLVLQKHSQNEVSLGYLVGFTCQFIAFSIIPVFFR